MAVRHVGPRWLAPRIHDNSSLSGWREGGREEVCGRWGERDRDGEREGEREKERAARKENMLYYHFLCRSLEKKNFFKPLE